MSTPTTSATSGPSPDPTPVETSPSSQPVQAMAESAPVRVQITSIGVDSELLYLGLRSNGALEVPPADPGSPAGWYNKSPTPGEVGPAVLLGHVNDTQNDAGVFARLDELKDGDAIEVTREDQSVATFVVTSTEKYSKDDFPTQKVYGNTETPEIRLITCDGYDPNSGLWGENLVVYGKMQ